MGSHTSRHTGKNSGFSTQDEHLMLLGLEALTDTSNFRSATRSTYRHTTRRLSTQGNRTNLIILLPGSKTGSPVANEAGLELDTWARAPRWRVWQAAPPGVRSGCV